MKPDVRKRCSVSKRRYCDRYCQKLAWFDHKKWCEKIVEFNRQEAEDEASGKNKGTRRGSHAAYCKLKLKFTRN